ncbi:MAG: hypothetical protein A3G25_21325 [Betaproteobacteria bacterium RIFCSPLOWO2_12_FULL_63_13]|nr:MAG: hypothetical protein A3G25_21325 [Betaproteobacteria bacterium RIFCSPLOWO2_12_FULL_63_13]
MKRNLKLVPVLLMLAFGTVVSTPVMAQYRGHGGYSHGRVYVHGHGGGVGLGLLLGAALVGLAYSAAPAYAAPTSPAPVVVYPAPVAAPAVTYVQPAVPVATPQQQADWYYCADSRSYYPYVRECPGGWQRVPATPPR